MDTPFKFWVLPVQDAASKEYAVRFLDVTQSVSPGCESKWTLDDEGIEIV